RPDLVVHMPDARDLVIDAKTPLDAYLASLDASTDEERQLSLRRHAQQVETRVRELASKSYWTQFERSPEFAVLFLPGDQFLAAAVEAYNAAVGSLERQVLPQARRFSELGVTADAPLAPLEPIGQLARNPGAPTAAEPPAPPEPCAAAEPPAGTAGASNVRKA